MATHRETYWNTYHRKEMTWEPSEGNIFAIVDGQMCAAQRSLEKAQRLAAYYMGNGDWDEAKIILAPCMFSRPDCHIDLPGPTDAQIGEAKAFKGTEPYRLDSYARAHKLAQTFM